jgi:hypothetical protein
MELSSCLTNKFYLIILILAIIKGVIVYSVGRSHDDKFEFHMPSLMEWITIILLITVLYIIGSIIIVFTLGNDIYKLEQLI